VPIEDVAGAARELQKERSSISGFQNRARRRSVAPTPYSPSQRFRASILFSTAAPRRKHCRQSRRWASVSFRSVRWGPAFLPARSTRTRGSTSRISARRCLASRRKRSRPTWR
jgi:hypothetical protein